MSTFRTTVIYENGDSHDPRGEPCGSNVMLFMHSNSNNQAGDWVLTLRAETYHGAVKDGAEEVHKETAQLLQHLDEELARRRSRARFRLESKGLRGRPDVVYKFFEKIELGAKSDSPANSPSFAVEKTIQETERRLAALWGVEIFVEEVEPDFIAAFEGTAYRPHGSGETREVAKAKVSQ